MYARFSKNLGLLCVALLLTVSSVFAQNLQSPAERTNFREGPTMYQDLMDFVYALEEKSELMQVHKITETLMGRDVVLSVLSNPPVYKASDLIGSDKPIVLIVNNVHGGEVAGKDASLILMRDLLFGDLRPLLDDVVVLNVPTINPDGAELLRRTNEQGFDMNRDYIKLESQEIHALVTKVINKWQPDIHIDTHHGGSIPYTLTYQTNMNPAGDKELMKVAEEMIVPRIQAGLRAEDYDGFWYTGPRRENGKVVGWQPTSVEPRKQHVFSTLANMVGFLFETPRNTFRVSNNGTKVEPNPENEIYKHQVRGQYIGQREVIKFARDEGKLLRKTVREAKMRATMTGNDDTDNDQVVLEYEQVERYKQAFWYRDRNEQGQFSEWKKESMPIYTKFEPTRTTTRPWGYILPPQMATIVPLMLDHEITVKRLIEPKSLEVEVYYATEVDNSQFFQGHYLKKIKAAKRTETIEFPAGSFFIPSGQPKSNFISYLFEPETNDNLATWSHLDTYLQARTESQTKELLDRMARFRRNRDDGRPTPLGQLIPMYRLMRKAELKGTMVENFKTYEKNRYIKK